MMKYRRKFHFSPRMLLIFLTVICGALLVVSVAFKGISRPFTNIVGYVVVPMQSGINTVGTWISDHAGSLRTMRELQEETGYTAGSVKKLLTFYPTCGYSSETLHIYICRDLTLGEKHWDDSECIEIYEFYPDELIDMIMRNEIKDAKTIIGLLFARQAGEL